MQPLTWNGGLIGKYKDYSTDLELTGYTTPTLVGSMTSSTNSSTITLPSGLQQGDIVFVLTSNGASTTRAAPTGYTLGGAAAFNSTMYYVWSYKIMGAVPDTTATGLGANTDTVHIAFAFRGVDVTSTLGPFSVTTPAVATSTTSAPNPPTITGPLNAPTNNIIVILGYADAQSRAAFIGAPSAFTLIGAAQASLAASTTVMAAYSTSTVDSATTTDPGAFTGTTTGSSVAVTFALRPKPILTNKRRTGIWSIPGTYDARRQNLYSVNSYSAVSTNGVTSFTYPADVRTGDLAVFFDIAAPSGTAVTPSGATNIINITSSTQIRTMISYKICLGNESGTTVGATVGSSGNEKSLVMFRGTRPISTVRSTVTAAAYTTGDPAAVTINLSDENSARKLIIFFCHSYNLGGSNVATWTGSSYSETSPNVQNYARWRVFGREEAKSIITFDTADTGSFNELAVFRLDLT
jgi:hypothetical protein